MEFEPRTYKTRGNSKDSLISQTSVPSLCQQTAAIPVTANVALPPSASVPGPLRVTKGVTGANNQRRQNGPKATETRSFHPG